MDDHVSRTLAWLRRRNPARPKSPTGACVYCGERAQTWDHVVPLCEGGTSRNDNLVPACRRCNGLKGRQKLVDFLLQIRHHRIALPLSAYPATGEVFPCPHCQARVYLSKPLGRLYVPRERKGEPRRVHTCAGFPDGRPNGTG